MMTKVDPVPRVRIGRDGANTKTADRDCFNRSHPGLPPQFLARGLGQPARGRRTPTRLEIAKEARVQV